MRGQKDKYTVYTTGNTGLKSVTLKTVCSDVNLMMENGAK